MTSMVERVGRALAKEEGYAYDPEPYDRRARAAIAAMRDPTETMTEAGAVKAGGATKEQAIEWAKLDKFESRQEECEDIFSAMIDAALSNEGTKL